jgi:hypothetical protein
MTDYPRFSLANRGNYYAGSDGDTVHLGRERDGFIYVLIVIAAFLQEPHNLRRYLNDRWLAGHCLGTSVSSKPNYEMCTQEGSPRSKACKVAFTVQRRLLN